MNVLGLVKGAMTMAVSAGVTSLVSNVIKSTTPDDLSIARKVLLGVGALGVAYMLSDKVSQYVSDQIDEGIDAVKSTKEAFVEIKEHMTEVKTDATERTES